MLQNKCRGNQKFKEIDEERDVVELLKLIKRMMHEFDSRVYLWDALSEAKRRFYQYRQAENESNVTHVKNVKNLVSVIEHYGGTAFEDEALVKLAKEEAEEEGEILDDKEAKARVKDKCMAIEVLKSSKYKGIMEDV